MPIDQQVSEFHIEDREMGGGIRQDLGLSDLRWRAFRNGHTFRRNTITKRKGYRKLNTPVIAGSPDILAGIDANYANGTQAVYAVAGTDAYKFNATGNTWDAQSLSLANAKPTLLMYSDYAILMNGTQAKKVDNAASWTDIGGSPPLGPYATVHNNRILVAGRTATPHQVFYSGIRNEASWDLTNDYILVTTGQGEKLTGLGALGDDAIFFTEHNTIVQWQNPNNKGDWERIDVSNQIGNLHHWSYHEISHLPFGMGVFWSDEGPYLIYRLSRKDKPVLRPIWEAVHRAIEEVDDEPRMPAFETTRFNQVVTGYQPRIQQVCFGLAKSGNTENNLRLCYDLRSLMAFVAGAVDQPTVLLYDNVLSGVYPADAFFNIRTGDDGLPSVTGSNRMFAGRNGDVFEMDETFKDDGTDIPFYVSRSGYRGDAEGLGGVEKTLAHVRVSATQNAGFSMTIEVEADGGADLGETTGDLDPGLGTWGDGGEWTDNPAEGRWNGPVQQASRFDLGVRGKNFAVSLRDDGVADSEFEVDEISLDGNFYERQ
jgi:hypothetical protein